MGDCELVEKRGKLSTSYSSYLLNVTRSEYPQSLGCNTLAFMLALPYVRKPAFIIWVLPWWETKRNLK